MEEKDVRWRRITFALGQGRGREGVVITCPQRLLELSPVRAAVGGVKTKMHSTKLMLSRLKFY